MLEHNLQKLIKRQEFCPSGTECDANEYWNVCGSSCAEPTCQNPNSRGVGAKTTCPQVCEARCECMAGYVRKGSACVKAIECEASCSANEEFLTCGSACRVSQLNISLLKHLIFIFRKPNAQIMVGHGLALEIQMSLKTFTLTILKTIRLILMPEIMLLPILVRTVHPYVSDDVNVKLDS